MDSFNKPNLGRFLAYHRILPTALDIWSREYLARKKNDAQEIQLANP
jgi:hypothetical protein